MNICFSQFLCGHGQGRKVYVDMRGQHPSVWHKVYYHFSLDSLILLPSVEVDDNPLLIYTTIIGDPEKPSV